MPETQSLVDIGKLGVQVETIKNDVSDLKKEMKTLSSNIGTALTEMKVAQTKFESTTEKVRDLDDEIIILKKDHIKPMEDKQKNFDLQCRIMKWVATIFFAGLIYALTDKIASLF